MRALVFLCGFLCPVAALAEDAAKCTDAYTDCQDTCSLRHGMVVRDSERLKLAKCIDKCKRAEGECRDQFFETQRGNLTPGALDPAKKKDRDDDLREDDRKSAIVSDDKPPPKKREREEEQPKRTATRADELGAGKEKKTESTDDPRYNMKFEEEKKAESAPKKEEKRDEPARSEAAPAPAEEKPKPSAKKAESDEPKKKKKERALDEWDPEAL